MVEKIVVVSACFSSQIERVMARGFSREQAAARIKAQTPVSETEKSGDFVIKNDGSFEETRKQVEEVFKLLSPYR